MENKLEVGQTCEVVEWLGNEAGYEKRSIGFQSINEETISDRDFYMYSKNGFIHASHKETKPIGRLTVKKVK